MIAACPPAALPFVLRLVDPKWRPKRVPLEVFREIRLRERNAYVVCYRPTPAPAKVSVCQHHLLIEPFLEDFSSWASGSFARALRLALLGKTYEAALAWQDFIFDPDDIVSADVFDPEKPPYSGYVGYPIFTFGSAGATTPHGKIQLLLKVFDAYDRTRGNDRHRFGLLEALAVAVGRAIGALGRNDGAIAALARVARDGQFVALLKSDDAAAVAVCPTYSDVEGFSDALTGFAPGAFAKGLHHALKGESYDAAFAWFDWVFDDADATVTARFGDAGPCPIFEFGRAGPRTAPQKIDLLAKMFVAYDNPRANLRARYTILDALGFALSRVLGALDRCDEALGYARRLLELWPQSIHVAACRHALELKAGGAAVPPRLQKFCGHDPHALDDVICHHPFTRLEITPAGFAHACCASLVPTAIGNIESENAATIIASEKAQKMRRSMLDGSYKYCNHLACPLMVNEQLPRKSDAAIAGDALLAAAVAGTDDTIAEIRDLAFGYDWSCNLSCPSCRRETIIETHKQSGERSHHIRLQVAPLLPKLRSLHINNAGEFLFSRPSRALLQSIDPAQHANLKIDLISNGTLLTEREWQKFANIHGLVRTIRISTDAATKETFEVLRRGARWESFLENLKFIGTMRRRGGIELLMLAFTYQLRNFREMPAFVGFAESVGADKVNFQRLQPSASMTHDEYAANAVHLPTHPLHAEFLAVLKDPALQSLSVAVASEFEFTAFDG
jgi:Iron-sulfur cluster-binding domain